VQVVTVHPPFRPQNRRTGVTRRRTDTLSSSICGEVLCTLERAFSLEAADEPDLGLNVSYLTSCRALSRLALAEPWEVPRQTVEAIRRAVARIDEMRDPYELEKQLLSFPAWVLRMLERRQLDHRAATESPLRRRVADGPLVSARRPVESSRRARRPHQTRSKPLAGGSPAASSA
jgi:hypothetical protein